MNKTFDEGLELAHQIQPAPPVEGVMVLLAAPYIHLRELVTTLADMPHVDVAAQNCHEKENGAYTGEVSAAMLRSIGVRYVILGHSERRQYARESNELLARKVDTALGTGLRPIFCCGESLAIREEGWEDRYVVNQLEKSLFHLSEEQFRQVIIAYEPIWAIGTGRTASPAQAQAMQARIRQAIAAKYGGDVAESTSILYGGSVKPGNAAELFAQPDVDGGLVGGASLKAPDFLAIIEALSATVTV